MELEYYSIPDDYPVEGTKPASDKDKKVIEDFRHKYMYLIDLNDGLIMNLFSYDKGFIEGIFEFLIYLNWYVFRIPGTHNHIDDTKDTLRDIVLYIPKDMDLINIIFPLTEDSQKYLNFLYDLSFTAQKFPQLLYKIQDCMKRSGHPVVVYREKINELLNNDALKKIKTIGNLLDNATDPIMTHFFHMYFTVFDNMKILQSILPQMSYKTYDNYIKFLGDNIFTSRKDCMAYMINFSQQHGEKYDSVNIAHLKFLYDYISRDIKFQALKRAVVDCLEKIMPNDNEIKLLATKVDMSGIKF